MIMRKGIVICVSAAEFVTDFWQEVKYGVFDKATERNLF